MDQDGIVERLRWEVRRRGTVPEVAKLCGMPGPTLETYLYGQHLPGTRALVRLSRGLGVSLDWLVFGEVRK